MDPALMPCLTYLPDFRFLFILFFMMSLINTVWCIFASPHFPDKEDNDDDEIPDIN
jgi:hypothetical protein